METWSDRHLFLFKPEVGYFIYMYASGTRLWSERYLYVNIINNQMKLSPQEFDPLSARVKFQAHLACI